MSDINTTNFDEDFDKDFVEFARSLEEKEKEKEKEQEFDCPICLELFDLNSPNLVKSCCGHYYCQPCYDRINICALCRKNLNKHDQHIHDQHIHNQHIHNQHIHNQHIHDQHIHNQHIHDQHTHNQILYTNYNVLRIMSRMGAIAYTN
jgi:hypothetical protein